MFIVHIPDVLQGDQSEFLSRLQRYITTLKEFQFKIETFFLIVSYGYVGTTMLFVEFGNRESRMVHTRLMVSVSLTVEMIIVVRPLTYGLNRLRIMVRGSNRWFIILLIPVNRLSLQIF